MQDSVLMPVWWLSGWPEKASEGVQLAFGMSSIFLYSSLYLVL